MLVLALDTTTRGGSVTVVRDEMVLALVDGDASRTHGERLPGEIDTALARAGLTPAHLDLLAVATGPGAFTGLRIGLAAIQGLAMVLGTPVVGVSALDALAETVWHDHDDDAAQVVTWMDAQRGEVFAANHRRVSRQQTLATEPIVCAPTMALATLPAVPDDEVVFVGDGAVRYRSLIEQWSTRARVIAPAPALAPAIARIARRLAADGAAGPPHALQPLYVRRPDAELDRDQRART